LPTHPETPDLPGGVDARKQGLYKTADGGGVILPPLFFEKGPSQVSRMAFSGTPENTFRLIRAIE
jgi:hypothetical protein